MSAVVQDLQSKELPTTRIQPDRRWFGNTRVIGQKQLDQFREEMSSKINDSYTVLLREKKLPLQLLEDPERKVGGKQKRADLLGTQPFADTFGPSRKRKKPKLAVEAYSDLVQTAADSEQRFESKAVGPQGDFEEFKDVVSQRVRLLPSTTAHVYKPYLQRMYQQVAAAYIRTRSRPTAMCAVQLYL